MAFADLSYADPRPSRDREPEPATKTGSPCPADTAICALEEAIDAIAREDVEGRCGAVGSATEAVTSLFLEMDAVNRGALAQGVGRIYEAILSRLVRINLRNDPLIARETIAMLQPLRKNWSGAWPVAKPRSQRANS